LSEICSLPIVAELEEHPEFWASDFTNAAVARARAELATAEGNLCEGITAMRDAIDSWRAAGAESNQSSCRFMLAEILAAEGDVTAATLELDTAQAGARLTPGKRSLACIGMGVRLGGTRHRPARCLEESTQIVQSP
jgi:ATP/maltotriose-dependent transcriptional regulator MalT